MVILVTCYELDPNKGSYEGTGWKWIQQIARNHDVIVVTRKSNAKNINAFLKDKEEDKFQNIFFQYFDLPLANLLRGRGAFRSMLYYHLWQKKVVGFIKDLGLQFDIAHNLNLNNDWSPSFLWQLNKPMVWGPIGHHDKIPLKYMRNYPLKFLLRDRLKWQIKKLLWKYSKDLKETTKKADAIIMTNERVKEVLSLENNHSKNFIIPICASEKAPSIYHDLRSEKYQILCVGTLKAIKGFDLAIHAFQAFMERLPPEKRDNFELIIVGEGAALGSLKKVAEKGFTESIKFVSTLDGDKLVKHYKKADVFLFPSHEGTGISALEAMSYSLPVISLDNPGPGSFIDETCGYKIKQSTYTKTVLQISFALHHLFFTEGELLKKQDAAYHKFKEKYKWKKKGEQIDEIYKELVHLKRKKSA